MLIGSVQSERWKEIKALLMDALALAPAEREIFLGSGTISPDIRREIESLLALENEADEMLSASAVELSRDFFDDEPEIPYTAVGQKIGSYRIVSELGIGGMGAVYLAERSDGKFDQKVAIKLLKREFNAGKIRESFRREIAIQSKLVHPNVAAILDTGTTDDGIPYIVMEYVEGLPIDKYCRENSLALTERLKIFNKACDAVAFAHQNLIVHRDLKPSNIIVTPEGNPKLLDFGISKLLGSVDDASGMTLLGAMTPEYASPEQIKGEGVSTATDIYSLGVILYKLLTGTYPYNIKNRINGDVSKIITEEEPVVPSSSTGEGMNPRSAIRIPQLKGDLDNIILKALRKEPEERYRTVEQFAEDIWRSIDGQPVQARPSTLAYRANKFFRRNRIQVIAGLLVFISLIAGIAAALWQTNVARAQANIAADARRSAEFETDKAKAEQAKSEKISKFMAKVLSYANPAWYADGSRFGGNARVIDAMEDLGEKIDTEFAGVPDIQAELHSKFSEVYWMAAKPWHEKDADRAALLRQKSRFHGIKAFELRRQYYGDYHEKIALDLFGMYTLLDGQIDESERLPILVGAIQMMRETNPNNLNLPYMIEAYGAELILPQFGTNYEMYQKTEIANAGENRYQIAARLYLEALPVFRFHYKPDNSAIFSTECRLSYSLMMQEKWAEFDEHYAICRQWDATSTDPSKKTSGKPDVVLVESHELFKKRHSGS